MLTQDVSQELKDVLEQLHSEGKEPTVALVKARLSTPVPMPALITTLKSWKSANRVPKVEVAAKQPDNDVDRIAQLEAQVAALTERLMVLEKKLGAQRAKIAPTTDNHPSDKNKKGLAHCQAFQFVAG